MISSFDVTSLYSNRKEIHQVNFFYWMSYRFKALYSIDPCILCTLREPAGELVLKKYIFFRCGDYHFSAFWESFNQKRGCVSSGSRTSNDSEYYY